MRERLALLPIAVTPDRLFTRDVLGGLQDPGKVSANGSCRIMRAGDGWVALNLARSDDVDLIPALTADLGDDWPTIERFAAARTTDDFVTAAAELQLPASRLAEARPIRLAQGGPGRPIRVLDLSALWAGPLCAGLLAKAGAIVVRIQNLARPDPVALNSPGLDGWLNAGKTSLALDLRTLDGRARLLREIGDADVLVTSARANALARLGVTSALFDHNLRLIWVAITAHGWSSDRVGFGDDCAFAGGLVGREGGEPRFMGDALADPLTGLEAALTALESLRTGQFGRLDIPLAGVAATYARAMAG
ncbi:CoA transferase [Novosphingobium sp. Gsoil 351]|uniref:CoA transferase n=1 Tax=Novosphingobium sp. Gsoil 351 TaxID=2675225 RepID=UPI0018A86A4E|nr:CoA transferase [Novosphingobium sp. Gsoil 351]